MIHIKYIRDLLAASVPPLTTLPVTLMQRLHITDLKDVPSLGIVAYSLAERETSKGKKKQVLVLCTYAAVYICDIKDGKVKRLIFYIDVCDKLILGTIYGGLHSASVGTSKASLLIGVTNECDLLLHFRPDLLSKFPGSASAVRIKNIIDEIRDLTLKLNNNPEGMPIQYDLNKKFNSILIKNDNENNSGLDLTCNKVGLDHSKMSDANDVYFQNKGIDLERQFVSSAMEFPDPEVGLREMAHLKKYMAMDAYGKPVFIKDMTPHQRAEMYRQKLINRLIKTSKEVRLFQEANAVENSSTDVKVIEDITSTRDQMSTQPSLNPFSQQGSIKSFISHSSSVKPVESFPEESRKSSVKDVISSANSNEITTRTSKNSSIVEKCLSSKPSELTPQREDLSNKKEEFTSDEMLLEERRISLKSDYVTHEPEKIHKESDEEDNKKEEKKRKKNQKNQKDKKHKKNRGRIKYKNKQTTFKRPLITYPSPHSPNYLTLTPSYDITGYENHNVTFSNVSAPPNDISQIYDEVSKLRSEQQVLANLLVKTLVQNKINSSQQPPSFPMIQSDPNSLYTSTPKNGAILSVPRLENGYDYKNSYVNNINNNNNGHNSYKNNFVNDGSNQLFTRFINDGYDSYVEDEDDEDTSEEEEDEESSEDQDDSSEENSSKEDSSEEDSSKDEVSTDDLTSEEDEKYKKHKKNKREKKTKNTKIN